MVQKTLLESVVWHMRSWDEIKRTSWFTLSNYLTIFLFIFFLVYAILQTRAKINAAPFSLYAPGYAPVDELENFDWRTTEPVKFRTFKPKYHLTMDDDSALETLDPNELILMDKNYESRMKYRRNILKENHDIVVGVNDESRIRPAVMELYTFLFGTYLPRRFPSMFKLQQSESEKGTQYILQNMVTNEFLPAQPTSKIDTITLLETLGKHLDEDFLLLLPEVNEKEEEAKYILEAYVTICPSGFNPREKLGLKLKDIHGPVPAYKEKLESSMDRFFTKLEVGKCVKRVNWTITTGTELFAAGEKTNHAKDGEEVEELVDIDVDKTFFRCERQTLHRLPQSRALVFAFKSYLYPIQEIKDEGSGEELAEAIDGLQKGNAPQMHFYKRGAVWGQAVKKFLRA